MLYRYRIWDVRCYSSHLAHNRRLTSAHAFCCKKNTMFSRATIASVFVWFSAGQDLLFSTIILNFIITVFFAFLLLWIIVSSSRNTDCQLSSSISAHTGRSSSPQANSLEEQPSLPVFSISLPNSKKLLACKKGSLSSASRQGLCQEYQPFGSTLR